MTASPLGVALRDRAEYAIQHTIDDPPAPLSFSDRMSLRLGSWLLLRATRRVRRVRDHSEHARLLALHQAEVERQRAWGWAHFHHRSIL